MTAKSQEWLLINTAPQCGRRIDLWIGRDGYRVPDAFWSEIQDWWCTDGYHEDEPDPLPLVPAPTHWRERPAPPITETGC